MLNFYICSSRLQNRHLFPIPLLRKSCRRNLVKCHRILALDSIVRSVIVPNAFPIKIQLVTHVTMCTVFANTVRCIVFWSMMSWCRALMVPWLDI